MLQKVCHGVGVGVGFEMKCLLLFPVSSLFMLALSFLSWPTAGYTASTVFIMGSHSSRTTFQTKNPLPSVGRGVLSQQKKSDGYVGEHISCGALTLLDCSLWLEANL